MNRLVDVFNLGRLDYRSALRVQKHLLAESLASLQQSPSSQKPVKNTLLLVEHDPVYTVGLRRKDYPAAELDKLRALGTAQVEQTDRGGLITFHGPGQLVAYPIFCLKNFNPSVKWYVTQLESVIIELCRRELGLHAYRLCNVGYTGVWSDDQKIAALGIHCKRYVTYHGLALNCNVDLSWFEKIVPCGIEDKAVTSLSRLLGREVTVDEMRPLLVKSFESVFDTKLRVRSQQETSDLLRKVLADGSHQCQ